MQKRCCVLGEIFLSQIDVGEWQLFLDQKGYQGCRWQYGEQAWENEGVDQQIDRLAGVWRSVWESGRKGRR